MMRYDTTSHVQGWNLFIFNKHYRLPTILILLSLLSSLALRQSLDVDVDRQASGAVRAAPASSSTGQYISMLREAILRGKSDGSGGAVRNASPQAQMVAGGVNFQRAQQQQQQERMPGQSKDVNAGAAAAAGGDSGNDDDLTYNLHDQASLQGHNEKSFEEELGSQHADENEVTHSHAHASKDTNGPNLVIHSDLKGTLAMHQGREHEKIHPDDHANYGIDSVHSSKVSLSNIRRTCYYTSIFK